MKVGNLIEMLSKIDPDIEVTYGDQPIDMISMGLRSVKLSGDTNTLYYVQWGKLYEHEAYTLSFNEAKTLIDEYTNYIITEGEAENRHIYIDDTGGIAAITEIKF